MIGIHLVETCSVKDSSGKEAGAHSGFSPQQQSVIRNQQSLFLIVSECV